MLSQTDQRFLLGLLKHAQVMTAEERAAIKERNTPAMPWAYPDYGKSLVARMKEDPDEAGRRRGILMAALGAVLGGAGGALVKPDAAGIGGGAALGAVLGGVPGYISGSDEAKSNYSKLLFLRRLGVNSLGEYDTAQDIPESAKKILSHQGQI